MLRWYLSRSPNFFSDWLWPYCVWCLVASGGLKFCVSSTSWLMLRWYLSQSLNFFSDWLWPYCVPLHNKTEKPRAYCTLVWPQWWSFADVNQHGEDFSKKISKTKIIFWFDFHRCSHGPSNIGPHFRKQSGSKIELFKKCQ